MKNVYIKRVNKTRHLSNKQFSALMKSVLEKGKDFRFQAAGSSMSPFIKSGDVITLSSVEHKTIHIGDILAVNHPINNNLVVHRVAACRAGNYLLKADNSQIPDGWIKPNQIIGVVGKIERGDKQINIGLGEGKLLIAILSRMNCLEASIRVLWKCFPPFIKRLFK